MESTLKKRVVTALILTAALLLLLMAAATTALGRWGLMALACMVCGACAFEFSRICSANPPHKIKGGVYFSAAFLPALGQFALYSAVAGDSSALGTNASALGIKGAALLLSLFFASTAIGIAFMLAAGRQSLSAAGDSAREFWVGVFLIGFCGGALTAICVNPYAYRVLLWLLLVVSINDIAAYFAGSRYGRTKLAPFISPNKTLIGSEGGLLAGVVAGTLSSALIPGEISWQAALMLSVLTVLAAQLGDLTKSYLKRLHAVKDSGSLLPGHGGVLDRADAVLMAAPVVYSWLLWHGL